jgi:hypothetical protein
MSLFPKIDLSGVRTVSIRDRERNVDRESFAEVFDVSRDSFSQFVDALPDFLIARDLRDLVARIITARKEKRPVVLMMGAHVVKVGLSPLIVNAMRSGVITAVAMNSAAVVHDTESALFGTTSEDVAENIRDGSFGMSQETGEFINGALLEGRTNDEEGFGESIGNALIAANAPNANISICATGVQYGVPVSVHAAIGTDIVHQQPTMDGAVTGEMTFRDFRLLATVLCDLHGGVVLNIGSAVILPEVFLKALTVARNLGHDATNFTTANFDMIQHYRPRMNVVQRPTQDSGRGYSFTGHHEIMVPLLMAMIAERAQNAGIQARPARTGV